MKIMLVFQFIIILNVTAQQVIFNEVMSSNSHILMDEDGDFPDWIELKNSGENSVNLNGFLISDEYGDLEKWRFPDIQLAPDDFLVVFASDKDRREWVAHWETIIAWGDIWKYKLGFAESPSVWSTLIYDDSDWSSGVSGFGYGDGDDATYVNPTISLYIRKSFHINDVNEILKAVLHVDYDDAFVAYLNGVEIARANIGITGIPPAYNDPANISGHEARIYQGKSPDRYDVESIKNILVTGENILAIQVHNVDITSSDLTMIPFFTLAMNQIPSNSRGVLPLLNLGLSSLHTNFKIKADGESLFLSDPNGIIIDSVSGITIPPDISYGRIQNADSLWMFSQNQHPV
jgi:hypothetical protein